MPSLVKNNILNMCTLLKNEETITNRKDPELSWALDYLSLFMLKTGLFWEIQLGVLLRNIDVHIESNPRKLRISHALK